VKSYLRTSDELVGIFKTKIGKNVSRSDLDSS
jgi:hypothetical protein